MWEGQTCFIVAGGPSALQQNLNLLRGRRVIAVNARYQDVPFADFVFGMDRTFFEEHKAGLRAINARLVTTVQSLDLPRLHKVRQATAPGHNDGQSVYCGCTSLAGAMDLARQLGVVRMVLIGADGHDTKEARLHHAQRYPNRPHRTARYRDWRSVMERVAKRMRDCGVTVLNASPGSAYADLWPEVRLEDVFNPNTFHEELCGPTTKLLGNEIVQAVAAARAVLGAADAMGKSRVKIESSHLRALVNGVAA